MDVYLKCSKRDQDPLFNTLRKTILEIASKYTPGYVNNVKYELHLDKSKKNVIINISEFNI
jgi:septum formation topological specificity factor MinE